MFVKRCCFLSELHRLNSVKPPEKSCDWLHSQSDSLIPLVNFIWRKPEFMPLRTTKTFKLGYIPKIFVERELKRLKKHKSTGLDQLPSIILRDAAAEISTPLTYILNLSITTDTVPKIWKTAKIIPIHKTGDTTLPENYCPISVFPILSKLLERSVHSQLLQFLEENHLLNEWQFGYRLKRSTKTASTILTDNIRREVDNGHLVGAVFIDLSKAFDTISHSVLLNKLKSYGIDGKELNWMTDYLFNRKQLVDFQNTYSDEKPLQTGVPQGSILGSLLFVLFLNDLYEVLKHSKIVKYADDTVIYVSHKDVIVIQNKLNEDMENISHYFDSNELIINLKKGKTESMLFGTTKRLKNQDLDVNFRNTSINHVKFYKYLGNIIDNTLSFERNFNSVYKKASGRLRLLAKLRPSLTVEAARKIYISMIIPLLTYSGTVHLNFNNTQLDKLSSLENRASKIISTNVLLPNIYQQIKKEACIHVRKCLDGDTCSNFRNYFEVIEHKNNTRNNRMLLRVPRVKLSFAKKSYYFTGVSLYNDLPLHIRKTEAQYTYKKLLNDYFA